MTTLRACCCCAFLAVSQAALAQGPTAAGPEGSAAAPTPPPEPAPALGSTPAAPTEPRQAIGVRLGAASGLGAFIPGPQLNWHLFELDAGVQVNPMFGAYLRLARTAGIGFSVQASAAGGSMGLSASGFWLLGANAELALGDSFFVAGGPQVGLGGWASAKATATTTGGGLEEVATSGPQPGLDLRLGFGVGGSVNRQTGRRNQVTVALDVSLLYATKVVSAAASGGTQGASVSVSFADAVSVAPTLQLGYVWR